VTLYIGTNDVALNYDPRFDASLAQGLRDNQMPSAQGGCLGLRGI